jgi:hypothetical protein
MAPAPVQTPDAGFVSCPIQSESGVVERWHPLRLDALTEVIRAARRLGRRPFGRQVRGPYLATARMPSSDLENPPRASLVRGAHQEVPEASAARSSSPSSASADYGISNLSDVQVGFAGFYTFNEGSPLRVGEFQFMF